MRPPSWSCRRTAGEEYVNLLRWRLQHVLGYKHTVAFDVKNVRGSLYHLVFATDNWWLAIGGDVPTRATVAVVRIWIRYGVESLVTQVVTSGARLRGSRRTPRHWME